jgi:diacylglycerol kinase
MIHRIRKHTISIKHAWDGVRWAFSTQPNYQVHLACSVAAIIGGVVLDISYEEFLVIVTLIVIGFALETVNTAIEQAADAISLEWREDLKVTKDVSAGAMLLFAFGAVGIAGIIFIPKIAGLVGI